MNKTFKISDADRLQIETAVAEAEKKTSGELVPMLVQSSHDYWWVHWHWAALCVFLDSAFLAWATSLSPLAESLRNWLAFHWGISLWGHTLYDVFLIQTLAAICGFCLPYFDTFKRLFLPRKWMALQVHRQSMANFVACGLTETRDRTGILIYISHLERLVEIIADKGIYSKVPKDFWKEQTDAIVAGIHQKKGTEALCQSIAAMGEELSKHYPPRPDDTDELSNRVIVDHQSSQKEPPK